MLLSRAEVEALAKEFARAFVDANTNPIIHRLIHRLDEWIAEHPEKAA